MKSNNLNYIEFKSNDLEKTKTFYSKAFGWKFTDYGPTYTAFENRGLAGGFEKTDEAILNGVLVILVHDDLAIALQNVKDAGGKIVKEIFSFPGGSRFQFTDPSGNELAVWKENESAE